MDGPREVPKKHKLANEKSEWGGEETKEGRKGIILFCVMVKKRGKEIRKDQSKSNIKKKERS